MKAAYNHIIHSKIAEKKDHFKFFHYQKIIKAAIQALNGHVYIRCIHNNIYNAHTFFYEKVNVNNIQIVCWQLVFLEYQRTIILQEINWGWDMGF